jgi:hypothetical protein
MKGAKEGEEEEEEEGTEPTGCVVLVAVFLVGPFDAEEPVPFEGGLVLKARREARSTRTGSLCRDSIAVVFGS